MACLQLLIRNHGLIGPECDIHCPSPRWEQRRVSRVHFAGEELLSHASVLEALSCLSSNLTCAWERLHWLWCCMLNSDSRRIFERCMCMWELSTRPLRAGEGCRGWQGALVGEVKWVENQKEERSGGPGTGSTHVRVQGLLHINLYYLRCASEC